MTIRTDRPLVTPPGMMKWWKLIFDGEYDIHDRYLGEVKTVVDVGACIGAFALWAVNRFPGCSVHCYEPNPVNFEALKSNVDGLDVTINNLAVSDSPGEAELVVPESNIGAGSTVFDVEKLYSGKTSRYMVGQVPGSSLSPCDMLKLDCEGEELRILRSLLLSGANKKPKSVVLEYHTDQISRDIQGLMVMQDYRLVECFPTFQGTYAVGIQKWVLC